MKKLCAIISGGEPDDLTGIHEADFIIACDRGYAYAKEAGIRPDLLVAILIHTGARSINLFPCSICRSRRTIQTRWRLSLIHISEPTRPY